MEQDDSQGLLIFSSLVQNIPSPYGLCLEEVGAMRRGPKELGCQIRIIYKTISPTVYSLIQSVYPKKKYHL